jgi:geranylgeranyl diphosphate synthase type I
VVAPASLTTIAARVEERLAGVLDGELARWSAFDGDLTQPLNELRRLVLAGGKRLRPAFCHWAFVGLGGDADDQRVIDAGAAFELMHAFALFHDDVMDDASERRGAPTTHTVYAAEHESAGWAGESRRFGDGMAILIGDLAFVYSDQLLADANPVAWRVWNELRIELNVGQVLDILGSVQGDRRLAKSERICRYKSGKYTIERPLHLGAALAAPNRFADVAPLLSAYGLPLGDAFQMRDDVLGAFGDAAVTGKPVGGDLREGKPTPLLALATAAADPRQRDVLERVGASDLSDDDIAAIQQVIVDVGALADLEDRISTLADGAIAALDSLPVTGEARSELAALADYAVQRSV